MEILIRLAGVQLGPYSEAQVRQHLDEGLLSLTDQAQQEGTQDWVPLADILANPVPVEAEEPIDERLIDTQPLEMPTKPATREISEPEKRAPTAPPGVSYLPVRQPEPSPEPVEALGKKTMLIGPSAPGGPAHPGSHSTATTSPLVPTQQATKKMSRSSLVKMLGQKTAPLPNRDSGAIADSQTVDASGQAVKDPKKALLPSLIKSLTAKTVPLRPVPAPIPAAPRPGAAGTAPLPTKLIRKPASEKMPPPSVVDDLTKKLGQVVQPDPVQTSPPTLGLFEKTTKLLPVASSRTRGAKMFSAGADDDSDDEPASPSFLKKIFPTLIGVAGLLAALTLYYVWSPYHASASLRSALDHGDASELAAAIDFPSVRDSLKAQIQNQSTRSSTAVVSMIDKSIDFYVTPEGLSGLAKGSDFPKSDLKGVISPTIASNLLSVLTTEPTPSQGLFSFGDFVIDRVFAMLHLQFRGLGWQLKRVDLRPKLLAVNPTNSGDSIMTPVIETYLEQGDAALEQGNWDVAIAQYTQVIAINPKSSIAYNDRGTARQSQGDLDGALKDFTQALALDPKMALAFNGRGNVKAAKNDLTGAIADFTQAVHLDPKLAAAYDSRGNAKTAKDDLEGAIADFSQAISIDPKLASAYSDRGFARQANGNLDGAISDYNQALALKPKTAMSYYNRGLARQSQGNLDGAITDFDRALAFDPRMAGAYLSRADAKNANHDPDGAIADYTQALGINPKSALAYSNRGLVRQAKGDLDGAVTDYTEALTLDPKMSAAYFNRGMIKSMTGELDGAIADSTQALYLDPKNAMAYYNRGFAKLTKGNLDGAQADLKEFCELSPKDHNADHARLYLWLIEKASGAKTDADAELSDAMESSWNSPPDDLVSKTAGYLLGRVSETDYLSASDSPDANLQKGQQCEAWYYIGMKRLLSGDKAGAAAAFQTAVATGQKDYCEYVLAQAELKVLETKPSPVALPVALPANAP
jgi:tetratricopeptide (TPR) repeat protein